MKFEFIKRIYRWLDERKCRREGHSWTKWIEYPGMPGIGFQRCHRCNKRKEWLAKPILIMEAEMDNATAIIVMSAVQRLELRRQLDAAMKKAGHQPGHYYQLGLGFDLKSDWPGEYGDIQMAKLCILAHRLKLRIVIRGLDMQPLKPSQEEAKAKLASLVE